MLNEEKQERYHSHLLNQQWRVYWPPQRLNPATEEKNAHYLHSLKCNERESHSNENISIVLSTYMRRLLNFFVIFLNSFKGKHFNNHFLSNSFQLINHSPTCCSTISLIFHYFFNIATHAHTIYILKAQKLAPLCFGPIFKTIFRGLVWTVLCQVIKLRSIDIRYFINP